MLKLILQAGFLSVAVQVALFLGALPAVFLLPANLPLQMAFSLPLIVGLVAVGVPLVTERIFSKAGPKPLHLTGMGAALCAAVLAIGLAAVLGVTRGLVTVGEAQLPGLVALYFISLFIARRWLA
ncbi:hypothetical protein DZK27_07110 [Rhodobacteraceae bacterium 63075]|nr:hypothetical protein DZK27_07110 [Rhodobacteraceae bacterium 63075]